MTSRRSLSLPAFSGPATDAPVPAQSGGRRFLPVEQGSDLRQPPGESEPAPAPARRPWPPTDSPSPTRTAMSERYHHGLRHVQEQLTTYPTACCLPAPLPGQWP
ncbi:hypothetical protein PUR61_17660 [Streptomyces sp. BE20]|uniref:hypothetical protein n=1 Tax=Streptomyces sp. BE20 TaxID=3002525 RepID=UPI002E765C16|nr:hypothetical protein [Streptomyces sp. BE20]MEE1824003.1 hypothetical protein [Streptomyces sp. BE20]